MKPRGAYKIANRNRIFDAFADPMPTSDYRMQRILESLRNEILEVGGGENLRIRMVFQNPREIYRLELERPDLVTEARSRAASVVRDAARDNGRYSFLRDDRSEVNDPSFFRGLAGIGYELLRLADPVALPSVLALAPQAGWGPNRPI